MRCHLVGLWHGDPNAVSNAIDYAKFRHRAWCNNKARFGKYAAEMKNEKAVA
jgi:hypothetical protein